MSQNKSRNPKTMVVVGEDKNPLIINADNFDPKKHKEWSGAMPETKAPGSEQSTEQEFDYDNRDAVKKALDDAGVEYNNRAQTQSLASLLREVQEVA